MSAARERDVNRASRFRHDGHTSDTGGKTRGPNVTRCLRSGTTIRVTL
jgi:hypothetical protein